MPVVRSGPNEYLLVGRNGKLDNKGSAASVWLLPGTVWVKVPSTKQEAAFEFTQETKDGIPLRFKGIVLYRVVDPVASARAFNFSAPAAGGLAALGGIGEISKLLTHICLGELRHAVSHMSMTQCIEERKTTLSGVVEAALAEVLRGDGSSWGVEVEIARVAQVFIVDPSLREQLEAGVRNEIRLAASQSDLAAREAGRLAELASDTRVKEQQLAADREGLRRDEELQMARLAWTRRQETEALATRRQQLALQAERVAAELAAEEARIAAEEPVRRLRVAKERELLAAELEVRRLQHEVRLLDVETDLAADRARQAMRAEILPIEQAPQIVEAASRVLNGTNLSVYGDEAAVLGQLAPVFSLIGRAVASAAPGAAAASAAAVRPESGAA